MVADLGAHLSQRGALVDTNNDGIADGFAHTVKNVGNFTTFSLTNGVLSLQPAAGGSSIGGSNTHVQFNDGGSLNGESTFVYNKATNTLTVSNLTVSDTLTVTTTTTLNSNTVTIGDAIIVLNSDATGSASANAGIEIERGDDANVQLLWDETNDQWDFDTFALGSVGKVYGAGSGAIYTFTSDTDTGVEHTGTDQLGLLVGNTRVLMVSANGVHIAPAGASGAGSNQALLVDDIVIDTQTISTSGSNKNVIIAPHGTGSVELGGVSSNATAVTTTASAHNVIGTSVTISAGSTTAGTTNNIAGGSLTLASGQGKGTGAGGSILFKTADGGSSGSTLNPLTTKMTILDSGFVGIAQNTPTVPLHVGGDAIISGNLTVSGTSTTVSTTNTFVTDAVMTLNSGETGNGVTGGVGGFEVDRGANGGVDNPLARFVFDESDDKWKVQLETGSGSGSYAAAGIVASSVEGTTGTFSGDLTVDTNVLKVDTANNRVGVNKTPTVALDVTGEVAGDGGATFANIVQGNGFLANDETGFLVTFINNNASATAVGMPLRIDGSHATSVVQANQAQSNSIANCAVGLATGATANAASGRMVIAGSVSGVAAARFTGSDPADGNAVYVSGTAGKLTVDVPTTGFVQQIGRIQDTNVSVSGNSGEATIIVSVGTPIAADVYDDDDNTQLTAEEVQDIVGAMFTGNTETNITATYEDSDGTIDLVSTDTNTQLTTEQVQDIVGGMVTGNTETGITVTYEDSDGTLDFVVSGGGSMSSWTLSADSGSNQTIADGNTVDIEGGTGIQTIAAATDKVTVHADHILQRLVFDPTLGLPLTLATPGAATGTAIESGTVVELASVGGGNVFIEQASIGVVPGFQIVFINTDGQSYDIQFQGGGAFTINGAAAKNTNTQYEAISVYVSATTAYAFG
tara:strand:+ start:1242 stop:3989 length:2748 start_codon:yes stop_codon:yes gene_type:complete